MEEPKNNHPTQPEDNDARVNNLLEQLEALKQGSVSKEEYDKVLELNKDLLEKVFGAGQLPNPTPPGGGEEKPKVDIAAMRKELYSGAELQMSDLEYVDKVLKLRRAIMETGEPDPAVDNNRLNAQGIKGATQDDYDECERVCKALEQMVEDADGDAEKFRSDLKLNTDFPVVSKNKK